MPPPSYKWLIWVTNGKVFHAVHKSWLHEPSNEQPTVWLQLNHSNWCRDVYPNMVAKAVFPIADNSSLHQLKGPSELITHPLEQGVDKKLLWHEAFATYPFTRPLFLEAPSADTTRNCCCAQEYVSKSTLPNLCSLLRCTNDILLNIGAILY